MTAVTELAVVNLRKCTRFGAVAIRCWRSSRKHLYRHRRADAFRGHVVSCMRQSASCSAIKEVSNAMSRTQRGSGTTSNFARRRFGHLQFGSRQGLRMPQATTATTTTADGLGLGLWSLHLKIHGYTARARAPALANPKYPWSRTSSDPRVRNSRNAAMCHRAVTVSHSPGHHPETERPNATARLARVRLSFAALRYHCSQRLAFGNGGTPAVKASRPEFEFSENAGRFLPEGPEAYGAAQGLA